MKDKYMRRSLQDVQQQNNQNSQKKNGPINAKKIINNPQKQSPPNWRHNPPDFGPTERLWQQRLMTQQIFRTIDSKKIKVFQKNQDTDN